MTTRISTTGILIAAVGLAAALVLAVALNGNPAGAAFPGKNGMIVFDRFVDGRAEIWTMSSNGARQRKLTNGYDPAFSANGRKIAAGAQSSSIPISGADPA